MPVANKLQDLKNQQKRLAEVLTSKGMPATATEKYDSLVDKVAQLEELRGEERTLTNIISMISKPESIVQLEYPIDNIIVPPYRGMTNTSGGITATVNNDNRVTLTGTATTTCSFVFKDIPILKAGNYNFNAQTPTGCHYTLGKVMSIGTDIEYGNITVQDDVTDSYWLLSIPSGTILNNVTIRQPILYKIPKSKTLNAKLGSKNLFDIEAFADTIISKYPQCERVTFDGKRCLKIANVSSTITQNTISPAHYIKFNCYGTSADYKVSFLQVLWKSGSSYVNAIPANQWKTFEQREPADSFSAIAVYSTNTSAQPVYIDLDSFVVADTEIPYTPYVSDFSTIIVTRCGKNLFNINNVYSPLNTDTYEISDNKLKVYRNRTIVIGVIYRIHLPVGTQYTLYYNIEYGGTATGIYNHADSKIFNGRLNHVSYTGTVSDTGYLELEFSRMGGENDKLGWVTYSSIQVEFGSTVTSYEPYQGQTYTPTATGEVTGITNLYPTTTLLTDNAGVVFTKVLQSTQGNEFTEILPSTGKNGITKINQPIIDSSVDDNIKPENIKKGVKILGVLGTYEGN